MSRPPIRVVQLLRHPKSNLFSIERVYAAVRAALPGDIAVGTWAALHPSKGLVGRLRDALAARRIDADVVHMTGDAHYLGFFTGRRRTILTVHDLESLERKRGLRRWLFKLLWFTIPVARAGRIVAISPATKAALLRHLRIDPDRVTVIPNPLTASLPPKASAFRTDRPVVLHVGTKANKNLPRHVEALDGLPVRLKVIGALDAYQRSLLEEANFDYDARSGLDDAALAAAYADADLLLFASLSEGFGLPILEAQAVGIPVVTSDREPMRGVAGDGALLVDPEDVGAIRAAVTAILGNPALRDRLLAAGRANVAAYAPAEAAARYAALYQDVAQTAAR